jgi:hypothetical protein
VQRPSAWVNQKVLYDAKRHTYTAQGLAVSTIYGDLLWCDGGWPGSCHEQELIEPSGLGDVLDADRHLPRLVGMLGGPQRPTGDRRIVDGSWPASQSPSGSAASQRSTPGVADSTSPLSVSTTRPGASGPSGSTASPISSARRPLGQPGRHLTDERQLGGVEQRLARCCKYHPSGMGSPPAGP